ncbi:hypothetical protein [Gemmata sp.]|uniref:hypothetical protein n=1 Tax=Gemmata sp. TaxID=1914242 RepID=UPI003F714409
MSTYAPPVSELLKLGRPDLGRTSIDYPALGIGSEHVPELIRLMRDESLWESNDELPEWYANIHAWRALGQLRAVEAIEPLLDLIADQEGDDWNDWVIDDVPRVLGEIGVPALAPTLARLNNRRPGQETASNFATAATEIARRHPEVRAEVIGHLVRVLQTGLEPEPELNGFIVADLLDLKAVEAWPAIEAAFALGTVDESIAGGAADVKYQLALGPKPLPHQSRGMFLPQSARNAKQRAESRARQRKAEKKKRKKRK